jgi:hypothetical protein
MIRSVPCVLLCLSSFAAAQGSWDSVSIPDDPVRFGKLQIDGETNHARTKRVLAELTWHTSVKAAARVAVQQDRPIVLIQALGDIRGFC